MMVVVIIGILAAVAVPNYSAYVRNAKMAEGIILIDALEKDERKFYLENQHFYSAGMSGGTGIEELVWSGQKYIWGDWEDGRQRLFYVCTHADCEPVNIIADGTAVAFEMSASSVYYDSSGAYVENPSGTYRNGSGSDDSLFHDLLNQILTNQNGRTVCVAGAGDPVDGSIFGMNMSPSGRYDGLILVAYTNLTSTMDDGMSCVIKILQVENGEMWGSSVLQFRE